MSKYKARVVEDRDCITTKPEIFTLQILSLWHCKKWKTKLVYSYGFIKHELISHN